MFLLGCACLHVFVAGEGGGPYGLGEDLPLLEGRTLCCLETLFGRTAFLEVFEKSNGIEESKFGSVSSGEQQPGHMSEGRCWIQRCLQATGENCREPVRVVQGGVECLDTGTQQNRGFSFSSRKRDRHSSREPGKCANRRGEKQKNKTATGLVKDGGDEHRLRLRQPRQPVAHAVVHHLEPGNLELRNS